MGESLPTYEGYKPDVHPGLSHVFQSAAFRFGHTLIPPGIYRRDASCKFRETSMGFKAIRLCSTWWDSNVSGASFSIKWLAFLVLVPLRILLGLF